MKQYSCDKYDKQAKFQENFKANALLSIINNTDKYIVHLLTFLRWK